MDQPEPRKMYPPAWLVWSDDLEIEQKDADAYSAVDPADAAADLARDTDCDVADGVTVYVQSECGGPISAFKVTAETHYSAKEV